MGYWPNLDDPEWYADQLQDGFEFGFDLIGDLYDEVKETINALVNVYEADCGEDSWWVKVTLAAPIAGDLLWMLITPSPSEILENYLEPKSGRGRGRRGARDDRRRNRRRGGRGLIWRGGIPDVDELIADRLPGREMIAGRRAGPLTWIFYTGINAADRLLWYWMLFDMGNEFATRWNSAIMESRWCNQAPEVSVIASGQTTGFDTYAISLDRSWWDTVDDPQGVIDNNGDIELNGTYTVDFSAAFDFTLDPDVSPQSSFISIKVRYADGTQEEFQQSTECQPGGSCGYNIEFRRKHVTTIDIGGGTPSFVTIDSASITMFGFQE